MFLIVMQIHVTVLQVFAIEFVAFAIEFVSFAVEFVAFALQFVINKRLQETNRSLRDELFMPWRVTLETLEGNWSS